jgi:hypothetical protein
MTAQQEHVAVSDKRKSYVTLESRATKVKRSVARERYRPTNVFENSPRQIDYFLKPGTISGKGEMERGTGKVSIFLKGRLAE